MKCPRCSGLMIIEGASIHAPEHMRCVICGNYIERRPKIVMPEVPPVDHPDMVRKGMPKLSTDELKRRKRESYKRYRADLKAREASRGR